MESVLFDHLRLSAYAAFNPVDDTVDLHGWIDNGFEATFELMLRDVYSRNGQ